VVTKRFATTLTWQNLTLKHLKIMENFKRIAVKTSSARKVKGYYFTSTNHELLNSAKNHCEKVYTDYLGESAAKRHEGGMEGFATEKAKIALRQERECLIKITSELDAYLILDYKQVAGAMSSNQVIKLKQSFIIENQLKFKESDFFPQNND
jgi:hypothetical protein